MNARTAPIEARDLRDFGVPGAGFAGSLRTANVHAGVAVEPVEGFDTRWQLPTISGVVFS